MTDLQLPISVNSSDWVKSFSDDHQIRVESVSVPINVVPDLLGMGAKDAVYLAERLGLNVQVEGRGKVVSQTIKPGTLVQRGSRILISFQ